MVRVKDWTVGIAGLRNSGHELWRQSVSRMMAVRVWDAETAAAAPATRCC